jgi:uncharacterized protein
MTAGLPSPVTVLATRTVRDGYQTEFETFLPSATRRVRRRPRPPRTDGDPAPDTRPRVRARLPFDSQASLLAWERSPQRAEAIARSAQLTESRPDERLLTGMETWFAAPTGGIVQPPPRWKMCLMSACGIYPREPSAYTRG